MKNFKVVVVNDSLPISIEDDILCHHGILNMKWGVRRYQNADGSLTEAGKRRYAAKQTRKEIKVEAKRQKTIAKAEEKRQKAIATAERKAKEERIRYEEKQKAKIEKNKIRIIEKAKKKELKAEEKERKKQEAYQAKKENLIAKGNPSQLYKNREMFTQEEFNRAVARAQATERLKDEIRASKQKAADESHQKVANVLRNAKTATAIYENYNAIMTGVNAVAGTNVPTFPKIDDMRKANYYEWAAKHNKPVVPQKVNESKYKKKNKSVWK